MRGSYNDDDDDEYFVYNNFSGDAENVVQARDVYGGVNYYEANDEAFEYTIPPYALTAVFVALFVASSSYSTLFSLEKMDFANWLRLLVSTALLLIAFASAYYWSAGGLYERRFRYLRLFVVLVLVILGYNYGAQVPLVDEISELFSGWLIWQF